MKSSRTTNKNDEILKWTNHLWWFRCCRAPWRRMLGIHQTNPLLWIDCTARKCKKYFSDCFSISMKAGMFFNEVPMLRRSLCHRKWKCFHPLNRLQSQLHERHRQLFHSECSTHVINCWNMMQQVTSRYSCWFRQLKLLKWPNCMFQPLQKTLDSC